MADDRLEANQPKNEPGPATPSTKKGDAAPSPPAKVGIAPDPGNFMDKAGLAAITAATLKKVLDRQRVVVYASYAMTAIAALGLGIFAYLNQSLFAFLSIVVAATILIIAMWIDRSLTIHDLKAAAPPAPAAPKRPDPTWSRLVPRQPLPDGKPAELAGYLGNIRNAAFVWLSTRRPELGLKPDQIRANVFLPDYVHPEPGDVCKLFIPDELRIGMNYEPEWRIRFRPWQGLTGRVFMEQKDLRYAKTFTTPEGEEVFDDTFELTAEQKKRIHPKLRWIASFPLSVSDGTRRKVAGVLNVDGLEHQLPEDDLKLLLGELSPHVAGFADQLAALPLVRIMILAEEHPHG
jgi:hypothetical protein